MSHPHHFVVLLLVKWAGWSATESCQPLEWSIAKNFCSPMSGWKSWYTSAIEHVPCLLLTSTLSCFHVVTDCSPSWKKKRKHPSTRRPIETCQDHKRASSKMLTFFLFLHTLSNRTGLFLFIFFVRLSPFHRHGKLYLLSSLLFSTLGMQEKCIRVIHRGCVVFGVLFWCFVLFCCCFLVGVWWAGLDGCGTTSWSHLAWSNKEKLVYAFLECHKAHMGLLLSTGHLSPCNKQPLRPTPPQTTYHPQPPCKSTLLCELLYTQTSMSILMVLFTIVFFSVHVPPYSPLWCLVLSLSLCLLSRKHSQTVCLGTTCIAQHKEQSDP